MKTDLNSPPPPKSEPRDMAGTAAAESEALLKDLAAQKDLHLRLSADFANLKRRNRQELESRVGEQRDSFIVELLPVIDNLERALASNASPDAGQFRQGVELTLKQLKQLLRLHGVESDEGVGLPFNPHRQEALAQGHDPAQPDHIVLSVLQRGYVRGDKVVRPAKVTVNDLTRKVPVTI